MSKQKVQIDKQTVDDRLQVKMFRLKSSIMPPPQIPTDDPRHMFGIRYGFKQSSEIYCRNNKRREELGLDPLPTPENEDKKYIEELRR